MAFQPVVVAAFAASGVVLLGAGMSRWRRRQRIQGRLRALGVDRAEIAGAQPRIDLRRFAAQLGLRMSAYVPWEIGVMADRADRAGLAGRVSAVELLGWKTIGAGLALGLGILGLVEYGAFGAALLLGLSSLGWFAADLVLLRYRAQRRRAILRDLPTVMDLLVLSMEAGMGIDRALRTIVHEYRSPLAEEIQRVLSDIELGLSRGAAFERMAARVGLEDLRSVSRAIAQSEELGVSLVGAMQTQSREVRLSRRRSAEAEALKTPIKMIFPLVLFILPTLFMVLLGPVGLRAGAALSGSQP